MAELERFFKSINFSDNNNAFKNAIVDKVVLKKSTDEFIVYIKNNGVLKYDDVTSLINTAKNGINNEKKCRINLIYDEIFESDILDYLKIFIKKIVDEHPSLVGLTDCFMEVLGDSIIIKTNSKFEADELNKNSNLLLDKLNMYGFSNYKLNVSVDEKQAQAIKSMIDEEKNAKPDIEIVVPKQVNTEVRVNKTERPITLDSVYSEEKNVGIDALVFDMETREIPSKKKEGSFVYIISLKLTDKTSSILGKMVKFNEDKYLEAKKGLKTGKWYHFSGNVIQDDFLHDLVFDFKEYEEIPSKDIKVVDDAEEKRVELHLHTMMSAMDSVIPASDVVKFATSLGHKAIAVTDHNCCQAFPEVFHAVEAFNKDKEGDERFKVLYGAEMNIVNDDIDIIFNNRTYNMLEDTFVVFDTETTGFYAGSDQMIEIGAVKIKNGEILDRFDELIDPHRPIPKKITELTFITDEMVSGKDDEETVTKRFLEWAGDLPMVAHNAKFDISFMKAACNKYNLKEFDYTVLDTMSIARMLHPEWPNHKLQTLTKKLDIPWDEDKHHRADYDAEGTALAYYKMCQALDLQNISTTDDLIANIDIESLVRFSYPFHATMIAKDRSGLKNLFKIISIANTKYLYKNEQPKIPRNEVINLREGLLIGSGCINNEIFDKAKGKEDEELVNMMSFYDYIEVQPISAFEHLIGPERKFANVLEAQEYLKRIIRIAKEAGKPVVATGDVHNLRKEDKIYREIIVHQKFNGKLHPLNRRGIDLPNMYMKTTNEMLEDFNFLSEEEAYEIVITNPNKIAKMVEEIEVIIDTNGIPFAPKIDDSQMIVTKMVYDKAESLYGSPLPYHIEERLALELYGAKFIDAVKNNAGSDEETIYKRLHDVVIKGPDAVAEEIALSVKKENPLVTDEDALKEAKSRMTAIIGANFDVIYLIAQKLVKHSNDEGFLVGSRGSVGSSIVAYMMGITEVNSLAPHYRCPKCQLSEFDNEYGNPLGNSYKCGFDLPDKNCPNCNTLMVKDGHDIPFQTFLGFNADKVPDIDLNFSDLNQASAHEYTKVLFGVDNVYRAGTIGTVAEKTAFGYVKGYCEDKGIMLRNIEIERLAKGCTGCKRTTGQHPGGIVVIPGYMEVFDFTPFQYPAEDPTSAWRTTHFDYHAIDQDVLKLDILGHTDPTQLRMIQDLTGDVITKVPLDDKKTMSLFTSTEALGVTPEQIMCDVGTLGVPEFGTGFTIQLVKDTKPTTFAELVKISGLSHGTDVWLGNAQELIKNNVVPFSKVIGCRDDIMVELMYGGLEPYKAFKIMEFVRKGKASKDPETWKGYVQTMQEAGIPEWFIESCFKIKYMFPKAHAAAYVTSAFRIAWYKVHKPLVYYCTYFSTRFQDFDVEAMLGGYDAIKNKILEIQNKGYDATNKETSVLETLKLALEASARGIKFKNIDIEKSDGANFVLDEGDNALIMPFRCLDGLGDSVATKIIEERNIKPFFSIEDFSNRGKVNQTTVDKLRLLGVFGNLPETSQLSLF